MAVCVAIPLAVGGAAALCTQNSMETFRNLKQPPLSPPGWLFPVVWTALFALMGIASYFVVARRERKEDGKLALWLYGIQLGMNFLWSIVFFNLGWFRFAFWWLLALWLLIFLTAALFYRVRRAAGVLLAPYLLWVAFAGYLNLGVALLNP